MHSVNRIWGCLFFRSMSSVIRCVILVSGLHRATCLRFLANSDQLAGTRILEGQYDPIISPPVLLILRPSTAERYRQGHECDKRHWCRAVRMEPPAAHRYSAEIKY